jgi:hypothetical protein
MSPYPSDENQGKDERVKKRDNVEKGTMACPGVVKEYTQPQQENSVDDEDANKTLSKSSTKSKLKKISSFHDLMKPLISPMSTIVVVPQGIGPTLPYIPLLPSDDVADGH